MLSCLSKMFSWLVQHRRVSQNPCKDVHRPEASTARDRVLTDAEIVKFWRATDAERKELSALLKLLLLTGCRLNEVAGMTRAELSDDGATWNIPGSRTKNKRPHVVVPTIFRARGCQRHRKRGICLHDHWSIAYAFANYLHRPIHDLVPRQAPLARAKRLAAEAALHLLKLHGNRAKHDQDRRILQAGSSAVRRSRRRPSVPLPNGAW